MTRALAIAALALLAALSLAVETAAQVAERVPITAQDGLLGDTVHCLHTTLNGWVLVGTSRGLNCWDGERLRQYSAGNGLAEGYITAACDHQGTLWAGSWGGGLSALGDNGWRTYTSANSPLPGDWISALASDGEGLWIATYGHGLAYLRQDRWTTYNRGNSGLPSQRLTCLSPDGNGGLYVGTESQGVAHLSAEGAWQVSPLPLTNPNGEVTALLTRADGQVWVGTDRGLWVIDLPFVVGSVDSASWQPISLGSAGSGARINALASREPGWVWIGSDQGVALWDGGGLTEWTTHEGLAHGVVSALTIDAQGRVWVGSYVRGLAVRGPIQLPQIDRLPVVLVHGWRGPESDELRDSEFWHLARWLREDGFPAYYVSGISPENTLHANAERLREAIQEAKDNAGADQVVVLAFSMGGLNTRAYLESSLYAHDVRRAFILGSPHLGEHLWLPFLLWEHLAWSDEPSTQELFPAHMSLFNRLHDNSVDVPYVLVAGDAHAEELPTLFRELPPSDGLVSTWSALGPETMSAERRISQDIHAWAEEALLLDLPSLLYPRTTYDAHVRPYLYGVGDLPGSGSPRAATGYGPVTPEQRSDLRTGALLPGKEVALDPFPVDTMGRVRFCVRWKGPPLEVSLRTPAGERLDSDRAWDDENSEYLELAFADFSSYVLTDTLPGLWTMELSADVDGREETHYVAYAVMPSSPLALSLETDQVWHRIGEEITLTAFLEDPEGAASAQQVSLLVYSPEGVEQVALTRVDGGREAPGEGTAAARQVFQGTYTPSVGGYHHALARVAGERGGGAFERGGNVTFGVLGDWAELGDRYEWAAAEAPEPGQLLRVQVGVVAGRGSDYLLSATLGDERGRALATVAHPVHLGPGDREVVLEFALDRDQRVAAGSALYLQNVALVDIAGAGVLLDTVENVPLYPSAE